MLIKTRRQQTLLLSQDVKYYRGLEEKPQPCLAVITAVILRDSHVFYRLVNFELREINVKRDSGNRQGSFENNGLWGEGASRGMWLYNKYLKSDIQLNCTVNTAMPLKDTSKLHTRPALVPYCNTSPQDICHCSVLFDQQRWDGPVTSNISRCRRKNRCPSRLKCSGQRQPDFSSERFLFFWNNDEESRAFNLLPWRQSWELLTQPATVSSMSQHGPITSAQCEDQVRTILMSLHKSTFSSNVLTTCDHLLVGRTQMWPRPHTKEPPT